MSERKTGRPSGKAQHIDEVKRLYLDEQWSLGEISDHLGPSIQTLSRWLQSEGVELQVRTRNPNAGRTAEQQAEINAKISASIQVSDKKRRNPGGRKAIRETRVCACPECTESFEVRPKAPQQYCSMSCAKKVFAQQKSAKARQDWEASPQSACACGQAIPYENRHIWRYCSDACRQQYGGKRKADPENWVVKTCRNCQVEFKIRKSSQSYGYYCSNECAAKHTKTKKHIVVDDAIVLDSGYEALLWGLCALHKVPIERYNREQGVAWREGCWYAPDFLVANEIAVELKGLQDDEDELKWSAFRTQIRPLVVLDGGRLREHLGSMVTRDGLIAVLWGLMDEGTWSCERDDCPVEREHQTMRDARLCKGEPPAPPGLEDLQNNGIATITKTP